MYIKLENYYYNLEHVASISVNGKIIYVWLKNRVTVDSICYKTPAEARATFDKIWEMVEHHNLSKAK